MPKFFFFSLLCIQLLLLSCHTNVNSSHSQAPNRAFPTKIYRNSKTPNSSGKSLDYVSIKMRDSTIRIHKNIKKLFVWHPQYIPELANGNCFTDKYYCDLPVALFYEMLSQVNSNLPHISCVCKKCSRWNVGIANDIVKMMKRRLDLSIIQRCKYENKRIINESKLDDEISHINYCPIHMINYWDQYALLLPILPEQCLQLKTAKQLFGFQEGEVEYNTFYVQDQLSFMDYALGSSILINARQFNSRTRTYSLRSISVPIGVNADLKPVFINYPYQKFNDLILFLVEIKKIYKIGFVFFDIGPIFLLFFKLHRRHILVGPITLDKVAIRMKIIDCGEGKANVQVLFYLSSIQTFTQKCKNSGDKLKDTKHLCDLANLLVTKLTSDQFLFATAKLRELGSIDLECYENEYKELETDIINLLGLTEAIS